MLTDKQLNDRLEFLEKKSSLTDAEEIELSELEEEFYKRYSGDIIQEDE